MGNSGSAAGKSMMPGAAVLKLGTENVVSEKPPPPDEDLKESLKDVGVDAAGMSAQEAKRCWSLVAHEDFWRSHYTWHPKKKRVKTWMFVHGRFRETAVSLVQATLSIKDSVVAPGFSGQAGRAAADATEASFKTLVKKIYQHSEFEDTQLFRFFREHLPDIRDDIRDLEADHSEKKLEENVLSSLHAFKEEAVKCKPDEASSSSSSVARAEQLAEEVVESVRAYATGLDTHLQKEERMLVGRWLNLTPQLYSTYRGYLVGKYRIAY